jgi:hypothetical protein
VALALDDELRDRLLTVAQKYAEERGWPWRTPVEAQLTRVTPNDRQWTVRTNLFAIGMNVRVVIREADLTIVEAGYLPR